MRQRPVIRRSPDPYPGIPRARSFGQRRRARRERRRRAKDLRSQLREARRTLKILVDSERFTELSAEVEHAREEVRRAWARWIRYEQDRARALEAQVNYVAESGVRLRRENEPVQPTIPIGAIEGGGT